MYSFKRNITFMFYKMIIKEVERFSDFYQLS